VTSNPGRWAAEHGRNRLRSTDVSQTITRSHETPRSRRLDWLSEARCKGQPVEIFFAADNERGLNLRRNERRAKQICWSCPVLKACRNYALNEHEPYGIWGALTPSERRLLSR
jgi:WhiB family transcriptional regulator, redox-sensing transcriptional regulator